MRVCLISHAYLESAYRHVLESLAAQPGVELAWFTPHRYKLNLQTASGEVTETSALFRTYSLPLRFAKRQGTFLYRSRRFAAALDDFQPDIILHEQEAYALGAGQIAFVAKRRRIPLVLFVWENVHRQLSSPRRCLVSYVLKRAAGLIAGSTGAGAVHRDWGFLDLQIVLPQMGTIVDRDPQYGRRDPGVFRVCYVGRLIVSKGVDCLLHAVGDLQRSGLSIHCTIAGRGDARADLERLSGELGLAQTISFTGVLEPAATKELMRSQDVLVLPSRRTKTWEEQFGRVLIEAMAEGTVPVGTRTGAIAEVIGTEELLFDENDDVGLAALLRTLSTDPRLLERYQREMWLRASTMYETHVVSQRKAAFLSRVLAEHR